MKKSFINHKNNNIHKNNIDDLELVEIAVMYVDKPNKNGRIYNTSSIVDSDSSIFHPITDDEKETIQKQRISNTDNIISEDNRKETNHDI